MFSAEVDSEGSKAASQINDSTKIDILEHFVEVEKEALANPTTQLEQVNQE